MSSLETHYTEVAGLVDETFRLWDVKRIGFSWRHYYLDHTLQVQALALGMAAEADGDPEVLRFAAILHDITKRYDGEILRGGDGKALLNEEGLWLNETVPPDRSNWVARAYGELGLDGQVHHLSGAAMTERVLQEWGLRHRFVEFAAKVVRGHLKGKVAPAVHDTRYREVEVRLLYDADTIDPNVGLTAFYRNIQINAGAALREGRSLDLAEYVARIPRWVEMKESFRDQMLTEIGTEICERRQAYNRALAEALQAELEAFEVNRRYGLLGVVDYLLTDAEDPSLRVHAAGLRRDWLPARERELPAEQGEASELGGAALARSREFIERLETELAGRA